MITSISVEIFSSILASITIMVIVYVYRKFLVFSIQSLLLRLSGIGIINSYHYKKFIKSFNREIKKKENIRNMKIMAIMGVGFLTSMETAGRLHKSILGEILCNPKYVDKKIKILLLNPQSNYVDDRAYEIYQDKSISKEKIQGIRKGIIHSLEDLLALKNDYATLSVRLYDAKPIWRIVFINNKLFLGKYLDKRCYDLPFIEMIDTKKSLYRTFQVYFDDVWESSKEIEITNIHDFIQ